MGAKVDLDGFSSLYWFYMEAWETTLVATSTLDRKLMSIFHKLMLYFDVISNVPSLIWCSYKTVVQ